MIKIRSNILFKTIALKSAVKNEFVLLLKAALARVVTNEEHLNEFWLAQSWVVQDIQWTILFSKQFVKVLFLD